MQKMSGGLKNRLVGAFKHKYADGFLAIAVIVIGGVLLALSGSAQFDIPSPDTGPGDMFSPDNIMGTNQPPSITDLESDRSSPQEAGSLIRWTARAEDPEGDTQFYLFSLKGPSTGELWVTVSDWSIQKSWDWNTASYSAGNYQIRALVKDEAHPEDQFAPSEKGVNFQLIEAEPTIQEQPVQPAADQPESAPQNQPPVMTGLTSSPASPQEAGAVVTWTAEASDEEDDGLQFMFLLDNNPATIWQPSPQWVWSTSPGDAGSHSIAALVRDGSHNMDGDSSKSASFTLNSPNEKPVMIDLIPDNPSPQQAGTPVTWTASASDPDGDPLLFKFFVSGLPMTDWQSSTQWTWTASQGESAVEVWVRDGKHADQDGFDDQRSSTFVALPPNQPPSMIGLNPDKVSPQVAASTITWSVDVIDPEEDPLEFLFLIDGAVAQDWSANPVWNWNADQVGSHVIEAKVRDGQHDPNGDSSKSASFEIVPPANSAPVLSDLSPDKESPQATGTAVAWSAVASDSENDPLEFQFLIDGAVAQDWSSSPVWNWNADQVGSHVIEAKVRDGRHDSNGDSSKSASFEVVPPANNAPVLDTLTSDKESPQATGTAVAWTAAASDSENDPLEFQFLIDGTVAQDWSANPVWNWNADQVGAHTVEVKVKDGQHDANGDSSKTASFEIVPPANNAPVLETLTPDKESPQATGTAVAWSAVASDLENDPLEFQFLIDGAVAQDWSSSPVWSWNADQVGSHVIEAKVRDGRHDANGDSSKTASFEIVPPANNAPVLDTLTPDKESPQATGTAVSWTAAASDSENDPLEFQFLIDGAVAQDWSSSPVWSWNADQVGSHVIEAKVRDGQHDANGDSSKSASFEIVPPANNAPILDTLTPDKESPQATETAVAWSAVASDSENDPLEFQFLIDGAVAQDWSANPVWSWNADQVGSHVIEAKVRDGGHDANGDSSKSASFEIVPPANNAPVLDTLTADKESPQATGTVIAWTAAASDSENDPLSYRFLLNETPATDWQPEGQWNWNALEVGTSTITVQVRDSQHDEPQGELGNLSSNFSIFALAPEIPEEEFEPAENETLIEENLTEEEQVVENATEIETPANETEISVPEGPMVPAENETAPLPAGNETQVNETINETEALTPSPETIVPGENMTEPAVENATIVEPANETEASKTEPLAVNQTPVVNSLSADLSSPQVPGSSITWTADASDAENDSLIFRFWLSGPATSDAWQMVSDWSGSNSWIQKTTSADSGDSQIKVQIRDGNHAGEDGFDSEATAFFTISERLMNISGVLFNDQNGNKIPDSGEALSGWTVRLTSPDGSELSVLTGTDGAYRFEQLKAGSYKVSEVVQDGWSVEPASGSYDVELQDGDAVDKNFANTLTAFSISGMKYNDLDGNGANDNEPGLEGWTIKLQGTPSEGQAKALETTTARDGSYKFESLPPGTYTITEVEQSGWIRTAPSEGSYTVDLSNADVSGKDFGNHGSWAVSGTVFFDANANGARDSGEVGQAGWGVQILKGGTLINATTSGEDGSYSFKNLAPGQYTLSEVAQEGWNVSMPSGGSYSVDLTNADVSGKDFGVKGSFTISGVKFYDANENGVKDSDEPAIPGQPVILVQNGVEIANITSGEDGSYTFSNLAPGNYEVDDPILVSISIRSVIVAPIPVIGPSSISGVKWNDIDGDGIKDAGESGIANWQLVLTFVGPIGGPVHDIVIAKTKTDATGAYRFKNLFPGVYKVSEISQLGWTPTTSAEQTVTVPGSKANVNFGNKIASQPGKASVWGVKFNDLNGNGVNNGEPGLSGWTIKLKNISTSAELTTTTNANGWYSFTNLDPGSYEISEVLQPGWSATVPAGGVSAPFALAAGENKQMDFGNKNDNVPPVVQSLTANPPGPQRAGMSISLSAVATDPDGGPLQYRFIVKGPAPSNQVRDDTGYRPGNQWTWSTIGSVPGDYQVEVWVRDGLHSDANGFDSKKSITYKLTAPNRPPRITMLFADRPAPQFVGSWIRWTAFADDPEGDPLQFKFYLRGPSTHGFWIDQTGWRNSNRWTWSTFPWDVGISEVLVAVRDGKNAGPGGSDDYQIASYSIINLDLPPRITGLSSNVITPQPIGVTVRWQASAIDPEGGPVFFRYWLNGPATGGLWRMVRDWSTDPTWTWFTSPVDAGTSQIQVQVRDGRHMPASGYDDDAGALFTVLRPNQPPTLTSLKADRVSPMPAGTPIKWTAQATDPDREPVFFKFWLKGPSTGNAWKTVQDWSVNNQWTWTSSGYDAGDYKVYVYARDGKHNPATSYDSSLGGSFVLSVNQPPVVTALTPDKRSPQSAGTAVKWTAKATDANREPILYRFWLKGPSTGNAWKVVQDWSPNNQWIWTSSGYDAGSYNVYVYVRDGKHSPETGYDSAIGSQYQLTANDPPRLTALTPDKPSPQTAGGSIRWTASALDPNRDPILYQFWLRGPATGNVWTVVQPWSTSNKWTWLSTPIDGGLYGVYVYASDGRHAPPTGYDSALGQEYQLLRPLVVSRVVTIGRGR